MPEYLAPGVYVEETSFRTKSIEGVSTTTTGFVGPARYGPIELAPEVLTGLLDFERAYGDRRQLAWDGDQYHNYLWHAARAFFEEGGKRLYVARVFRPLTGTDDDEKSAAYTPPPALLPDEAKLSADKLYKHDGHARRWLTQETATLTAIIRAFRATLAALDETQAAAKLAEQRATKAVPLAASTAPTASEATAATKRAAEDVQQRLTEVNKAFTVTALSENTLSATLLANASTTIRELVLHAEGADKLMSQPLVTSFEVWQNAQTVYEQLEDVKNKAVAADTATKAALNKVNLLDPPSGLYQTIAEKFRQAQTDIEATMRSVEAAYTAAGPETSGTTVCAEAQAAKMAYEANNNAAIKAKIVQDASFNIRQIVRAAVAQAATALGSIKAAEAACKTTNGISTEIRGAANDALQAVINLSTAIQTSNQLAQTLYTHASGAWALATTWQNLLTKLDTAKTAASVALQAYTGPDKAIDKADAVVSPAAPTPLKTAIEAAKTAVGKVTPNPEGAAGKANEVANAVTALCNTMPSVKIAFDKHPSNVVSSPNQDAENKATEVTRLLKSLTEMAATAATKMAGAAELAASEAPLKDKIQEAVTAAKGAVEAVTQAVIAFAEANAEIAKLPGNLHSAAAEVAQNAAIGVMQTLQALENALRTAAKEAQDAETQLTDRLAVFAGTTPDGGAPNEAVLLRARFPGAYGNFTLRFSLRLSDNVLRGDLGKAQAPGLQPGDFVWIGQTVTPTTGDLLLATKDDAANKEWRFGPDTVKANVQYWLNSPTDPTPAKQLDPKTHFLRLATLTVTVIPEGGVSETWENLALHPAHTRAGAPDSFTAKFKPIPDSAADARLLPFAVLTQLTTAGEVFKTLFGQQNTTLTLPAKENRLEIEWTLVGGNDGQRPGATEYEGQEKDYGKTGLIALEDIDDISIVATPGATYGLNSAGYRSEAQAIFGQVLSHVDRMRYRIAVLDSGNNQTIGEVRATCAQLDSKYAALYYPWVKVLDPVTRKEIYLPPSGFVTGVYARNDITRGVYKAPANEVVNLALGFERLLNKSQQEVLNPLGINCFRYFPGRGYRLWGARTLSSDPEWKYVNLRRYFAYLEHSIDKGTQWAVFEPNGHALWANVRRTIEDFLFNEWQMGALLGEKPEKAYFVKCDRTTMTQNDLDNGRLVCLIGVAPLRPAEFVIFRIGQWTGDHKV